MSRRVLLIRHRHGPEDDRVATTLAANGYEGDSRYPFAGDPAGEIGGDVAGVVIYGGPYNAYDTAQHSFLREEYRLIGEALGADIPLLGICQGAQMIAHHAGAWVGPPEAGWHEFGYYEITPTEAGRDFLPAPLHMAQAHFHTFDVPAGAESLASSALFPNQAFRMGPRTYGLQFHAEQTKAGFSRWQSDSDLYGKPGVQSREVQTALMHRHDAAQDAWFTQFLARLFPPRPAMS
ncbi:MAG: glutamine amidotransferase [Pseudooceanicola sp.]|nr:glutamine amidotransferase [Pseudooceanicola sp.]